MPKEKATRKTKSKVADAGGKKKKGTSATLDLLDRLTNHMILRP